MPCAHLIRTLRTVAVAAVFAWAVYSGCIVSEGALWKQWDRQAALSMGEQPQIRPSSRVVVICAAV